PAPDSKGKARKPAFPFLSVSGGMAEGLCSGLQSRLCRFESDSRLQALELSCSLQLHPRREDPFLILARRADERHGVAVAGGPGGQWLGGRDGRVLILGVESAPPEPRWRNW